MLIMAFTSALYLAPGAVMFLARYHEIAILIAHTAIDEGSCCLSGACL